MDVGAGEQAEHADPMGHPGSETQTSRGGGISRSKRGHCHTLLCLASQIDERSGFEKMEATEECCEFI